MSFPTEDRGSSPLRAAMACLEREDRVLVQERRRGTSRVIEFPGGRCDPGESFLETARRELREELGVTVETPCLEERVISKIAGGEIAFCRLPCPLEAKPRIVLPQREQVFSWHSWEGLPWERFLETDRAFIALQRLKRKAETPLPEGLVEAMVLAAVSEADPGEILFWMKPVLKLWGRDRLIRRLDQGANGAEGSSAGNWARLRRVTRDQLISPCCNEDRGNPRLP